jgi:hypothetical protein
MKNQRGFIAIGALGKALGGLLDMVPSVVWLGLVVAAVLVNCSTGHKLEREKSAHKITTTNFADYRSAAEKRENERAQLALAKVEEQRELERFRNKAATETQNALLAETARTAAARALFAERQRVLDNAIDRFAAPSPAGGQGGGDPAAVARAEEKASTLGRLLKTCRAEGRDDAGELEDLASQVRGLIAQYESLLLRPPQSTPAP